MSSPADAPAVAKKEVLTLKTNRCSLGGRVAVRHDVGPNAVLLRDIYLNAAPLWAGPTPGTLQDDLISKVLLLPWLLMLGWASPGADSGQRFKRDLLGRWPLAMPTGWEPGRAGKPQQWVCHATSYQACGPSKGRRWLPSPPQLPGHTSMAGPGPLEGRHGKVGGAELWSPEGGAGTQRAGFLARRESHSCPPRPVPVHPEPWPSSPPLLHS